MMEKEQIKRYLDIIFLQHMTHALKLYSMDCMRGVRNELNVCYGILFSASVLGLITDEEFSNINYALAYTSIKY